MVGKDSQLSERGKTDMIKVVNGSIDLEEVLGWHCRCEVNGQASLASRDDAGNLTITIENIIKAGECKIILHDGKSSTFNGKIDAGGIWSI
jgi:hypothetical protein